MKEKQFDKFWEVKCPKCNNPIDIEIVINSMPNPDIRIKHVKSS